MITASANGDTRGVAALAAAARSAASSFGALDDVAGLGVKLMADDAQRRRSVREETAALTLEAVPTGTELCIRLTDHSEPSTGAPATLLALVDAGLATAVETRIVDGSNVTEMRLPLPSHDRLVDTDALEVLSEEVPISDAPVAYMPLAAQHTAALTRCIYRCYGWSYPSPSMYYPDRIAAALEAGTRIGEVALDPSGEAVAHWGAVFLADGVVETGGTVTDPRFRRRGLANVLGDRLLERLLAMGVHGRLREPVLTHSATQAIALREGAVLVGVNLHAALPLQQVGITNGLLDERVSISVFYGPLTPLPPAVLHVPAVYVPIVKAVLARSEWGFDIAEPRGTVHSPTTTVATSSYDSVNRVGNIEVTQVGTDLVEVVDEVHTQLRRGGAEVVRVMLPLDQPATASAGAGLGSLGFAYAYLAPRFGQHGNVLFLQWLRTPDVDMSTWVYADPHVEQIARLIVGQIAELNQSATALRRREARRQQLLAALPTAD